MDPVIEVNKLSKSYHLGEKMSYLSLRDSLIGLIHRSNIPKSTFWALKNINFQVKQGEVVGIIGPNGAGKSTLLKLLSRISYPTSGEAILRGRVASLLEVGTGFHQELTGRENIFLNGAILGMSRQEINTHLEEIIGFSGVRKFIDTPVKHYSSGMRVRLAFAVAAHLNAEILLIDEVLAVGDIEFQKKCLDKMQDLVKNATRTILFVSHNLPAVVQLCNRTLHFEEGKIVANGPTPEIVSQYSAKYQNQGRVDLSTISHRKGMGTFRLKTLQITALDGSTEINMTDRLRIIAQLEHPLTKDNSTVRLVLGFYDPVGVGLIRLDTGPLPATKYPKQIVISTQSLHLTPVDIFVNYSLYVDGIETDHAKKAFSFSLLPQVNLPSGINHQNATTYVNYTVSSK